MPAINSTLVYRPLWAGISIISSTVRSRGTAGFYAKDKSNGNWLITAKHVFFDPVGVPDATVGVYQPDDFAGSTPINELGQWIVDDRNEVIAAKIATSVAVVFAWPSIGSWSGISEPRPGLIVVKEGVATGVTRGRISGVDEDHFSVEGIPGTPKTYQVTASGDSGSGWMDPSTGALIGIHIGERADGSAFARRADKALTTMGLMINQV